MFDIFLTEESAEEPASEGRLHVEAVYGKIRIGEFHETFIASLFFLEPGAVRVPLANSLRENNRRGDSISADNFICRASRKRDGRRLSRLVASLSRRRSCIRS